MLFQHNVEAVIWKRHAERAGNPAVRAYFQLQARRMLRYEGEVCRGSGSVIAVSEAGCREDARRLRRQRVAAVPTGVDLDYFAPQPSPRAADLVFVGSMDWMPNMDGVKWFVSEILPAGAEATA